MKSYAHGTSIEAKFKQIADSKGWRTYRSGWPDFLLVDESGARFVEVKSSTDVLSDAQTELFEALTKCGIKVFIWWELTPSRLIPWKRFLAVQNRVRASNRAPAPLPRPVQKTPSGLSPRGEKAVRSAMRMFRGGRG